jgi:23S rRNA-/tRNA-specific pseudouridylate synthase
MAPSFPANEREPSGVCEMPVDGKPARTFYRVVRTFMVGDEGAECTVLDLWPVTGRTHQLRRHMKALGHPIVGDTRYGGNKIGELLREGTTSTGPCQDEAAQDPPDAENGASREKETLCLWAVEVKLPHPATGEESTFRLPPTDATPEWLFV